MTSFQSRLAELSKKLDRKEVPLEGVTRMEEEQLGGWVVVKTTGETSKQVGFNLSERDAKILAASQRQRIMPTEDQDFLMISYQVMPELSFHKPKFLEPAPLTA